MSGCSEYQVVKAETAEEALENGDWKVGDLAECCSVRVIANSDKTWSIFPQFKKVAEKDRKGE